MIRKLSLGSLAALVLVSAAQAQSPCPSDDLSGHTGAWKPRSGYSGRAHRSAPAASYNRAAADAALSKLLALIQSAYPEPKGGIAYFTKHLLFSTPYREWPFGYSLYVGHTGYYCTASNKLVESGESGVFLNLDVNSFDTASLIARVDAPEMRTATAPLKFNADDDGGYRIGGRAVYRIPGVADRYQDVDRYTKSSTPGRAESPSDQWFVVRKDDAPLFAYVTRKQYLQQFRAELETFKARQIESDRAWAKASGTDNADWQARLAKGMDSYVRAVDAYLETSTEADLAQPVSEPLPHLPVDLDNPQVRFRDGEHRIAFLNQDYLNKKQPLHVPQFIVIRLTIREMANPPAWERRFRDQIQTGLDFAALKALLGR